LRVFGQFDRERVSQSSRWRGLALSY
jgi:hypothetical protein